jgi:hypothetical protein
VIELDGLPKNRLSVWGVTKTRKIPMFYIGGNFALRAAKSVGTTGLRGFLDFNEFA